MNRALLIQLLHMRLFPVYSMNSYPLTFAIWATSYRQFSLRLFTKTYPCPTNQRLFIPHFPLCLHQKVQQRLLLSLYSRPYHRKRLNASVKRSSV